MVHTDHIWNFKEDGVVIFEKETLLVTLFQLNPIQTKEESIQEINKIYKDLQNRFKPWIDHYVWDSEPIEFHLVEEKGYNYIYGQLILGDLIDDEWLITKLLFDLTKSYPDLYIHLNDNEGEFLLVEGYDCLPDWLEPSNSSNRDWINQERILIIPEQYYQDRGLNLIESLKFLEKANYKCIYNIPLNERIKNKLIDYPIKSLQSQIFIEFEIPRNYAGLLMRKNILNESIFSFSKEIGGNFQQDSYENFERKINTKDLVKLKIKITGLCYLFIQHYLQNQELGFDQNSQLITQFVESYINENQLELIYSPSDDEIKQFNDRGDKLQIELIRLMQLESFVEPKLDHYVERNGNKKEPDTNEAELISKLETFFKDTEAGIKGVNNMDDILSSKLQEEFDQNDDSTDDEEIDKTAKEFFKDENIDIDEDDFFEFFSKEALKLNDEDLAKLRNFSLNDDFKVDEILENKNQSNENGNINYDNDDDDEYEDYEEQFNNDDFKASLAEMIKSLKSEGGLNGPASTFFENLTNS
ncbi:hypothetical protein WICMUC_001689 [Wickerhamomyces mucosus]|uniref:Uncharacterized protein n=1 Tax=Wickerhamomyces mucosus TaxID=1378264 RepID=A0A9P8TGU0_9ASCO|nr:hypothetical protein WICMUC_001689 [Wickerhamomyces mucosus]